MVWRRWNAAYPLQPKAHLEICKDNVVARLHLPRTLYGKHAVKAYQQPTPGKLFVLLCDENLFGWQCSGRRLPALDKIDANLIITRTDFAWTFGIQEKWRNGLFDGGPVFVKPEMLAAPSEPKWLAHRLARGRR
jgi:hypothetical protein